MDSARLGRVLGAGARGAARTLFAAVDAASAPGSRAPLPAAAASTPRPGVPSAPPVRAPHPSVSGAARPADPIPTSAPARESRQPVTATAGAASNRPSAAGPSSKPPVPISAGLTEGTRRFGVAVARPVRRLSGVLWLEFTGVFFGLFALSAGIGAWRLYGASQAAAGGPARNHFLFAAGIALVFAYFCITSFVRAGRRSRRA